MENLFLILSLQALALGLFIQVGSDEKTKTVVSEALWFGLLSAGCLGAWLWQNACSVSVSLS
jgi:hypothetical protein